MSLAQLSVMTLRKVSVMSATNKESVMQLTTVGTYYQNSKVITWARCVVVLWFLRDFGKTEILHGVDYG